MKIMSLFCFYVVLCLSLFLFSGTSVFADCPDQIWGCAKINKNGQVTDTIVGTVKVGCCWKWSSFSCEPCEGYAKIADTCNRHHYEDCNPYGCAACAELFSNEGYYPGPCYDCLGNKLRESPPTPNF